MASLHYNCGRLGCTRGLLHVFCKNDKERIGEGSPTLFFYESGGQKQRVILVAALLRNNPILILDEPTSGLDGRHMRIIAEYLKNAAEDGTCILVITHDREFINIVADKVLNIEV